MEVDGSVSSSGDDPLDHIGRITVVKYINFRYNMLLRWEAGTKDSSTKCLMFQVLFFLHNFLQNPFQELFQFIF